jgi:nitrate reductase gamma subunit
MNDILFFIVLPYLSLASLFAGSVYRYHFHGFQVSSLSSQFLESRQLYFGSRPFHWGLLILFAGHLIAFLIPRAVLVWNELPLRLYILEITAFSFGLISLAGLVFLIRRRMQVARLKAVTTRMDVFVYILLFLQLGSGLWTAFFYRWGSSWFALVLTPYLRSVFTLSPDISAITALPFMIKLHIISAYVMIGMIPYTRFMHFLVYPFAYLWRNYQLVIWNRDQKESYYERNTQEGVKPGNN